MKRTLFLDIETTNLGASMGRIMCVGLKFLGESTVVLKQTDYEGWNMNPAAILGDKAVLKDAVEIIKGADELVTWYGAKFDVPFINSRLIINGLDVLPPMRHIDLCWVAQKKLKFDRNGLGHVVEQLGLPPKGHEGTQVWKLAQVGHGPSINKLAKYCANDVDILEAAYHKLLPMVNYTTNSKPNAQGACKNCGHNKFFNHGHRVDHLGPYVRLQCRKCGTHTRGRH